MKRSSISLAYHEAGHAVVAIAEGLHVESVSIRRGAEELSDSKSFFVYGYHFRNGQEQKMIARSCILGMLAGLAAEKLYSPETSEPSSQDDFNQAFELSRKFAVLPRSARCIGDDAHMAYLKRLQNEAARLVRKNWTAVVAVAETLLEKKTVNAEELESLFTWATAAVLNHRSSDRSAA